MFDLFQLKRNPENPRTITKDQLQKLKKSIEGFEKMMSLRPIIYDEEGFILGGNMRFTALEALGFQEVPENWVKLAEGLTEEQKREFIIKDNVGFGSWDWDVLANEWDEELLNIWGLKTPTGEEGEEESEDKYTTKIESPIYKPKGKKPNIEELFDDSKCLELTKEIESQKIDPEIKEFLKKAAQRHISFNYAKIAEYYAHASPEVQDLIENSALVIIDYNKAIEKGFLELYDIFSELSN